MTRQRYCPASLTRTRGMWNKAFPRGSTSFRRVALSLGEEVSFSIFCKLTSISSSSVHSLWSKSHSRLTLLPNSTVYTSLGTVTVNKAERERQLAGILSFVSSRTGVLSTPPSSSRRPLSFSGLSAWLLASLPASGNETVEFFSEHSQSHSCSPHPAPATPASEHPSGSF